MSRIDTTLSQLQAQGRKALIPFVTAGFPFADSTPSLMHAMAQAGADIIMQHLCLGERHPRSEQRQVLLDAVLDALEKDHDFLLRGNVMTEDLLRTWIEYKRTQEADAVRLRPHPYEFSLYYDL